MEEKKTTKKTDNLETKILRIQTELKAPKGQFNSFGKYKYRSCEDILEALKPLLLKEKVLLTIRDEIILVGNGVTPIVIEKTAVGGDRFYIKADVTVHNAEKPEEFLVTSGFARESQTKKGMDASQITGASSSYARKYALNGMFCIDDNKDSDNTNKKGTGSKTDYYKNALTSIKSFKTKEMLKELKVKVEASKNLTKDQKNDLVLKINAKIGDKTS